ncbi:hypothetical protein KP509_16G046100 [Ceratopteris richardii]|nr:hypothetical protein KP509_16G046100 [Ceratopteris richardii]
MQQIPACSGLQGSQGQGPVSSQSARSVGDPHNSRLVNSRLKKRERNDGINEPVKQQRVENSGKCEEGESTWRPEASSLVGKDGGISSVAAVDRLVFIMQYEWNDSADRQLDLLMSRTMLSKVVATTSDMDCLFKFLKLGGLAILDKWLQEACRGKHFTSKEISPNVERAVDDLLLSVLGALERLPVDLLALKTCPVGRSVNLLRTHKSHDIQSRSKKLVDLWKKRVESEMGYFGGNIPLDISVGMQQQDSRISTKSQHGPCPGNTTLLESSIRAKVAPLASLCPSPEWEPKAVPSTPSLSSVIDRSDDLARIASFTSSAPASPLNGASNSSLGHPVSTSLSENARTKSTLDVCSSLAIADAYSHPSRGTKSSSVRNRKVGNGTSTASSISVGMSPPVAASKGSSASGLKDTQGFTSVPVAGGLSSSSSFRACQISQPCDGSSRSSLNSLASAECNKMTNCAPYSPPEPMKPCASPMANVAASENSINGSKCPDSPSFRGASVQRILTRTGVGVVDNIRSFTQHAPKVGGRQDGENYDQISSTVSSPSETSAHVDLRVHENKRVSSVCASSLTSQDASDSRLLSTMLKDISHASGSAIPSGVDHDKFLGVNDSFKRAQLKFFQAAEAVDENGTAGKEENKFSGCVRGISLNTMNSAPENAKDRFSHSRIQSRISSSRYSDDIPLAARQFSADVHRQSGLSKRGSIEAAHQLKGNNILPCDTEEVKLKLPESQAGESIREPQAKLDLDLNRVLYSDDSVFQIPVFSHHTLTVLPQDRLASASVSKPALPVVPMTPVAAVAAAKGPFTFPSIPCPPRAEFGWKGSAATSAFRPTQRHCAAQKSLSNTSDRVANTKVSLDFDLNVAADQGPEDHESGLNPGPMNGSLPEERLSTQSGRSTFSLGCSRPLVASLDLNKVNGDAGCQERPVLDLNSGPAIQDTDGIAVPQKPHRIQTAATIAVPSPGLTHTPTSCSIYSGISNRISTSSTTNCEFSHPLNVSAAWVESGASDAMMHFKPMFHGQPGVVCPPSSLVIARPYGGMHFGFHPALQAYPSAIVDTVNSSLPRQSILTGEEQHLASSLIKSPPYMMNMITDVIQQQGNGSLWCRSDLDLNAGPEIDPKNAKDERQQMLVLNEQIRKRQQNLDIGLVSQQREQDGGLNMQGVLLKQPVWN